MREVKFRAWDSLYKEWIDNVWMALDGTVMSYSSGIRNSRDPRTIKLVEYTGLKDKNGKEVYEGDILLCAPGTYFGKYGVVEWERSGFSPFLMDGHESYSTDSYEVVGNIYENKELLDGTPR